MYYTKLNRICQYIAFISANIGIFFWFTAFAAPPDPFAPFPDQMQQEEPASFTPEVYVRNKKETSQKDPISNVFDKIKEKIADILNLKEEDLRLKIETKLQNLDKEIDRRFDNAVKEYATDKNGKAIQDWETILRDEQAFLKRQIDIAKDGILKDACEDLEKCISRMNETEFDALSKKIDGAVQDVYVRTEKRILQAAEQYEKDIASNTIKEITSDELLKKSKELESQLKEIKKYKTLTEEMSQEVEKAIPKRGPLENIFGDSDERKQAEMLKNLIVNIQNNLNIIDRDAQGVKIQLDQMGKDIKDGKTMPKDITNGIEFLKRIIGETGVSGKEIIKAVGLIDSIVSNPQNKRIRKAFEDGNRKKRAQGKPETNLGEIKRSLEQRFSQIAAEYDAFLSDKEIEKKLTLLKNALDGKKVTDGTQLKIPPLEKPSSTVSGTSPTPSNTSPTAPETPVTPTTDNDEKDRQAQIQRILDLQKQVRELEQKINQQ